MKEEMRNEIKKQLEEAGYIVDEVANVSNGVTRKGFSLRRNAKNTLSPVFYEDQFEELLDDGIPVCAIAESIFEKYVEISETTQWIHSAEDVRKNLIICLQRDSQEDLIKQPSSYEGIEMFLCAVSQNGEMIQRVRNVRSLLVENRIHDAEAWDVAIENIRKKTDIRSMAEVFFCEIMGMEEVPPMEESNLYLMTLRGAEGERLDYGAGAALNRDAIAAFAKEHHVSTVAVLPSSIHEVLLVPGITEEEIPLYSAMVADANLVSVPEENRLTDRAYILKF